eukprot:TRINITY_DN56749_c0_g1_i1.p1 TRINITY_DN56749_c0_g1~~TRINITY_DN56749_c0_g1_i1.p1  ORF type:complete len:127 (-),score=30.25 TRINITY_DN56749_c0_g1_i1:200-580(-)
MLLIQIHYLNLGIERFEVLLVVPVYMGFWIIFTALAGLLTYREYDGFDVVEAILFPLGVLITLCGVYLMSLRPSAYTALPQNESESSSMVYDEQTKSETVPAADSESSQLLPGKKGGPEEPAKKDD